MFSERVPRSLRPNRITQAIRRARADRRPLIDLTATNPTSVNLSYPTSTLAPLASSAALTYDPQPFGLPEARRAIACDYARRGIVVDPQQIILATSTSEAYSLLFKLLCGPCGDAVAVPVPSYPLFEHLTTLDGVRSIPYRLDYHGRWAVAFDDLDRSWAESVRVVLAVSPNNPTGSVLAAEERNALQTRCADRDAALILDEVFADYPLNDGSSTPEPRGPEPGLRNASAELAEAWPELSGQAKAARSPSCLTFRLGGLSKSAGLPQVKLAWIAVDGPREVVREALDRLEVMCDAYLSVSTPVQIAAPALIESGASVRAQILERIRYNYRALQSAASSHPAVEVLKTEAGWSSVLRVPSTHSEEDLVVDLIDRAGVLVHPGFFFDFPHEAFLIVSLLPEPQTFAEGTGRLLGRVDV